MKRLAGLLLTTVLLAGCTAGDPAAPGAAKVDVDTPELRAMKKDAGVEPCHAGDSSPVEGGLPELTLSCLGGGPSIDLSSLEGPVVINVWASWCGPCRKEMPVIQGFHERYGDEVTVIGIDYQDVQVEEAFRLVGDSGVTYPLLADPQGDISGTAPFPRMQGLPFWMVVDASGKVAFRTFVAVGSQREIVDMVTRAGVGL